MGTIHITGAQKILHIEHYFWIPLWFYIYKTRNTPLLTYLLTPCSRVLLENLTGSQLVKKFPAFLEPKGSLRHSYMPANCPNPMPAWSSPLVSFPQVSPPKPSICLSSPPICATCPAPSHSSRLTWAGHVACLHKFRSKTKTSKFNTLYKNPQQKWMLQQLQLFDTLKLGQNSH